VLADWKNEYKTKAPAFEADILRTFAAFIEQGLVYRSKKPVYWSIPFQTALAEAEIEYKDLVSIAVWVRFRVADSDLEKAFGRIAPSSASGKPCSIIIWTTTPWTLPANLAVAVNPDVEYVLADLGSERIIVAAALLEPVLKALEEQRRRDASAAAAQGNAAPGQQSAAVAILGSVNGAALESLQARHPFIDRAAPVVLADYVTTDSGTGCVHTAPGHGYDDYLTGLKYGLEIYCPVGADGRYLDDGRVPADMVGLTTLESVEDLEKKRTSPANVAVLKKLAAAGALFAKQNLTHSYPHCWRSKTPIVFRAVDQWFVSLDKGGARLAALEAIGKVQWIPAWGEARIRGAVETRPDWCISRQRSWGVPIPAFYDADKRAYLDADVVRAIADKVAVRGANFWFEAAEAGSAADVLDGVVLPAGWPDRSSLSCGRDTLDVWFDSGSTHAAVLRRKVGGTQWPADLYLEGSDQHRGWFQSSLWTGVVAFGSTPYKAVLTHGFIVDEERKKISKSNTYAKPQTSDSYIAEYGADVMRLWISSQNFRDDIPISKEILSHVGETYRLLRNTFRFQLSNLFDFKAELNSVPVARMGAIDRWALHQTAELLRQCTTAYEACEFHRVYQLCNQFCAVTLSATYHDILKDRLYTLGADSQLRRSSQTALHHILNTLVRVLSPIITFTADEAWSFAAADVEYADGSVHLQDWPVAPTEWTDAGLAEEIDHLISEVRVDANSRLEVLRQQGAIGKSLDAAVKISGNGGPPFAAALRHKAKLAELLNVSYAEIIETASEQPCAIEVFPARDRNFVRCPRCWRWVPALRTGAHGELCPRCDDALTT
jgi:isoleucyl-tRNA synthetase